MRGIIRKSIRTRSGVSEIRIERRAIGKQGISQRKMQEMRGVSYAGTAHFGYWIEKGEKRPWWNSTWRTSCGRYAEGNRLQKPTPNEPGKSEPTPEFWKMLVENFQETGSWNRLYGPEPGQAGCRAPRDLFMQRAS